MTQSQVLVSREYETIYILRPDVGVDAAAAVSTRLRDVLAREGAKLTKVETWGRRALAYRIQKYRHGIYVYLSYVGCGGLVAEVERNLRMLDAVIRFQTVVCNDEPDLAVEIEAEAVAFEPIVGSTEEAPYDINRELGLGEFTARRGHDHRGDADDFGEGGSGDDDVPDLNSMNVKEGSE